MISVLTEQVGKVLADHFEQLVSTVHKTKKKREEVMGLIHKVHDYFEELYAEANAPQQMQQKAQKLRALGKKVIRTFRVIGTAESVTPYLHAVVCVLPHQYERFDILALSGQGLENFNQCRKQYGKINRKITKESSPTL